MVLIDFILNIAALALWLNWLAISFDPLAKTSSVSLIRTLRKADPSDSKRWVSLAALVGLVFGRALIYTVIGGAFRWSPSVNLGVISLFFRVDSRTAWWTYLHFTFYSCLSFALTLEIFYMWLLLLSVANRRVPDTDSWQRLVRVHLRRLENWPMLLKILLPFLIAALGWFALQPLCSAMAIVPKVHSFAQLAEQAALIGVGSYLAWKYLIAITLLLHLVHSYVYLGNSSLWNFADITARNLLTPLRWLPLRIGKVDLLPVLAIALVFLVAETFSRLSTWFYLPF
jgi:hypothetical protein